MSTEASAKIGDLPPVAQLVDCVPEPADLSADIGVTVNTPRPTETARDATLGQTGADPPPGGSD